ncbi:MAG TPA: hypothetical protein VG328_07325 [Stellaceae bacterium]|jgi:hypothetical protein|nr:hypothetical protein [Stellaceae bacterium]
MKIHTLFRYAVVLLLGLAFGFAIGLYGPTPLNTSIEHIRAWLEMAGEWAIAAVIVWEVRDGLHAYRISRMFEAVKFVEDDITRDARAVVYEGLVAHGQPPGLPWWQHDDKLAKAAGLVCARYNLLGAVTLDEANVRRLVVREWGRNIIDNHRRLESYIEYREKISPGAFQRFTDLYNEALASQSNS